MSGMPLPILEAWRLDVDDRDETLIRGTVDGQETVGLPIAWCGDQVQLRDGHELQLGQPHAEVADAPHRLPQAAVDRRMLRLQADVHRLIRTGPPGDAELDGAPELTCWMVQDLFNRPYLAGYVHGHPRLPDGAWITTSPLVWLSPDQRCARTMSRWYRLRERFAPERSPDA